MVDELTITRRRMVATGAALSAALAGCSGSGDADGTATEDDGTATETTTEEAETTARTTEDPGPTLAEFEYPAGASRDGLDGATLFRTHESTLTDAGSAALDTTETREFGSYSETVTATKELGAGGVSEVTESDDVTESLWSPSSERAAYVRMEAGFEQRFRIDNQAPSPNEVAEFRRFGHLLTGAEWSEATEVVEAGDDYAVVYESAGIADEDSLLRLAFGRSVSEFEARVSVTQSGYVRDLAYDVTVERDGDDIRRDVSITVDGVGETTVEAPDWAETARERGVQFSMDVTDDRRAVVLEMRNGDDVPAGARLSLSSGRQRDAVQLSDALSEGDRLYLALSDGGGLLIGEDGVPDGATGLEGFVRTTLRFQQYQLFEGERQL